MTTIGRDGRPHMAPVTFVYNPTEETIDVGGIDFANTKKWRDVQNNRNVTFLVDDFQARPPAPSRCAAMQRCRSAVRP